MQIEANSWKQDDGSSFTAAEQLVQFYGRFAVQAAENGWLRLYLLYLDGQPVAHIYGVVFRNHYYALKTSYHSAYRNLAPASCCSTTRFAMRSTAVWMRFIFWEKSRPGSRN